MALITKITDLSGNEYLVQGAGTVYNEEKNSIALGKDTVANGKDQFVFGRDNVEDNSSIYAEVVGGGNNDVITNESSFQDYIENLSVNSIVTIKISNYYKTSYRIRLLTHDFSEFSNKITPAKKGITFQYGGSSSDIIGCFEAENIAQKISNNDYSKAYFIAIKTTRFDSESLTYVDTVDLWTETLLQDLSAQTNMTIGFGYGSMSGHIVQISNISKRDIRTLDWSGNEKLTGGLEIGGSLKIGNTTLSEAQLALLLDLLADEESES